MGSALLIPNPITSVEDFSGAPWPQTKVQGTEDSFSTLLKDAIIASPVSGTATVAFSSWGGLTFYVLPGLYGFPMPKIINCEFGDFGSTNPYIEADPAGISMLYGFKPYKWSATISFSSFAKSEATTTSAQVQVPISIETSITQLGVMLAFTFPSSATLSSGSWKTSTPYSIDVTLTFS